MAKVKLKLNTPLRGHKAGNIVTVKADDNGNVLDSYWRRRLKDAETDGCVEVVKESKKSKKSVAPESSE